MEFIDQVEAGKFWKADDADTFPLPLVAIALGVGRNKMHRVPVARIMIDGRACYKKGDILDWALSDDGKATLIQLRSEKTKIGNEIKARTKNYDRIYTQDPKSHYRPSNVIKETKQDRYERLCREWCNIERRLNTCSDDEDLENLIKFTRFTRQQFVKLCMGLPRGMELSNWWFAENLPAAKCGRVREIIKYYQDKLVHLETYGRPSPSPFPIDFIGNEFNLIEVIESIKQELVQLNAELNEIN